jgi:putative salt-induced outer membrane protein
MKFKFGLALVLAAATTAHADWTGTGEAGLIIASGNTETETANARLVVTNEIGQWKHNVGAAMLLASNEGIDTAERFELFGQSDYNFGPKTFAFGSARYEDDRFSGFEYQAAVSGGIGRHFIANERTNVTGTAGAGYKFFETSPTEDALGVVLVPGEEENEIIFRGTLDAEHAFTETTKLINNFIVESGATNTFAQNILALQVKMSDKLALALGYTLRHNTDPPAGFNGTDRLTTVNLVYAFK